MKSSNISTEATGPIVTNMYSLLRSRSKNCTNSPGHIGAPVAQWVKRWPTDLADRVRSPLEAKSSQP